MIGLMNQITGVDQTVFHHINGVWTNPLLDRAMPALSYIGNLGAVWIAPLGAMVALGKRTGRSIAFAGLASGWVGVHLAFRRRRPIRKVERGEKASGETQEVEYVS